MNDQTAMVCALLMTCDAPYFVTTPRRLKGGILIMNTKVLWQHSCSWVYRYPATCPPRDNS